MRTLFFLSLLIGEFAFANQVTPQSFSAQLLPISITNEPFVNYMITIAAKDFPSTGFGNLSAKIVDNKTKGLIVKSRIVYGKPLGTTIVGNDVISFSLNGLDALYNIKYLKNSSIVFDGDDGSSFSVNISDICASNPKSFMNLNGGYGCDVNLSEIDAIIKEKEAEANSTPKNIAICNDIEDLKPLVELFCSKDMESIKTQAENEFSCKFSCK